MHTRRARNDAAGFSLAEALIATSLLAASLAALAQLFALALTANDAARRTSMASVLAEQKIEEVRSAPWTAAAAGIEYLNDRGEVVASRGDAAAGAAYVRRWRIESVAGRAATVALHVSVHRAGDRDAADFAGDRPAMARMFAIKVRHGP